MRSEEIPAGKYAGKHRATLDSHGPGKPAGGPMDFRRVVCGACEKQYNAASSECPRCGVVDEDKESYKHKGTLKRLYWGEGLSQAEIGERFGVSHNTIHAWMHKLGVETREEAGE